MGYIQILGAGECGLPLAYRLQRAGLPVTLIAARDATAVLNGTVTSTQVKFPATLDLEAAAGMGHWRSRAPEILGIRLTTVVDGRRVLGWTGFFTRPAQSVDQRTVFARWLTDYVEAGGDLEIAAPSLTELDRRAAEYDLTVVTRALGELADCFPDDPAWPVAKEPARRLAVFYLEGVAADPDNLGTYASLPGLGEVISYPGLTGAPGSERCCEILLIEALPGGPLDVFDPGDSPSDRLRRVVRLLGSQLPADLADRYREAELTDAGATLTGAVRPMVRRPVAMLPLGELCSVVGMWCAGWIPPERRARTAPLTAGTRTRPQSWHVRRDRSTDLGWSRSRRPGSPGPRILRRGGLRPFSIRPRKCGSSCWLPRMTPCSRTPSLIRSPGPPTHCSALFGR